MFEPRLRYASIAPDARAAVMTVNSYVLASGLEKSLIGPSS
jgi:hypothetical protein